MKRPQGFDRQAVEDQPSIVRSAERSVSRKRTRAASRAGAADELRGAGRDPEEPRETARVPDGRADDGMPASAWWRSAPPARTEGPPRDAGSPREPAVEAGALDADALLRHAERARRRFEKEEVRRFTRRTRHRRSALLIAAGAVVLVVLAVVLAVVSPMLALRDITVVGASGIGTAKVESALRGQLGKPLAFVDQGSIRADLARFPQIQSYSTQAVPPGTLVVRIVERVPVGVVAEGSRYDTVDAAHVVIAQSGTRPAGLPLIRVAPAEKTSARVVFAAVAEVLRSLPATVLERVDTVTATTPDDVSFTLGAHGPSVVWGTSADSNLKAADLARLLALQSAATATEFDVSAPYSVVVR